MKTSTGMLISPTLEELEGLLGGLQSRYPKHKSKNVQVLYDAMIGQTESEIEEKLADQPKS